MKSDPSVAERPEAVDGSRIKTIEDHFTDWESHVFGFGYGTGEAHILPVVRQFFETLEDGRSYDHNKLEAAMGPQVAWLLINALCHADVIEYGTSPRFGWITHNYGEALRSFILSKSTDELYELTSRDSSYTVCYPDACNCGPNGYEEGRKCGNPFWRERSV